MKRILIALFAVVLSFGLLAPEAEAKRVGGGKNSGIQRQAPAQQQAAPAPAPGKTAPGAVAQPKKNSWMGPLAGLAAGLGLAALFSSLGIGEGMGSFILMLLAGMAIFMVIRWIMSRRSAPAQASPYAAAGHAPAWQAAQPAAQPGTVPAQFSNAGFGAAAVAAAPVLSLPAGFDAEAFAREARLTFIRMQAANDSGDLNDLRQFTSPEMFAEIKLQLAERGNAAQQTDVVNIDAALVDFAVEGNRQIASVRFNGLIREETGGVAQPFDELWHFTQWRDSGQQWVVAGIQQLS
ncbi:Tim44 domain-containing protein [Chitinilyticum piscinae]|uniref:Tim44 domain-containing protein n=1 Tax=Chitinilyticum piscinae TaxID=2866724 RepID=A0A8J7FIT5_9NEIS|nr:Tim44-like domain-containing protein [Chitinilyticum piscinae]MBE9610090.1 Tim44 domain-containing protein [Chitinilyticum piscinae]